MLTGVDDRDFKLVRTPAKLMDHYGQLDSLWPGPQNGDDSTLHPCTCTIRSFCAHFFSPASTLCGSAAVENDLEVRYPL
jgi:hypothetical protein